MPQATDVILNSAGYMVQPGSYKRMQDGMAEGRTGRVVMRDFFGGGLRPFQLERDRAYVGFGVGPVFNGQGVWPWPAEQRQAVPAASDGTLPFRNTPVPAVHIDDYVYFGIGPDLYKTAAMGAATWSAPTVIYSFAADKQITGLFDARGEVGCSLGTGQRTEVIKPDGTYSGPIMGDPQSRFGTAWAGHVVLAQARIGGATDTVYLTAPAGLESRMLDSPIVTMGLWEGKVVVATRQSLYTFSGRTDEGEPSSTGTWSGEFIPFHSDAWSEEWDDYPFIAGYGGKLYSWVNKAIVEYNPAGDRAGWRATGLEGIRCYGGCVAAGLLVVAIETVAGRSQLWAWDGAGWWKIRDAAASSIRSIWPVNLAGVGNWDLLVFRDGSLDVDLFRLIWRDDSRHALSRAGEFSTSMLDAGERDKDKAWRKVGAVFASPVVQGAVPDNSSVDVALQYNAGGTDVWTEARRVTKTGNTIANHNFTLEADISADNPVSRFLQLRTSWTVNGGWAPVLAALWAEFETLDAPARRRKWSFVVAARDQTLDRDGAQLTRTGRQLIAELWNAWKDGAVLLFRDQDYDADPTERRVRIVGIEEAVPNPKDAARWGESLVKLTLVEV